MAAKFPIHPLSRFETAGNTTIRRPREFLCFSFDEKHKIHLFSTESLRYYYPPFAEAPGTPVSPIDLSKGFDTWVKADDSIDNHLDGLLETIQAHEESLTNSDSRNEDVRTQVDVMTWRGMMTKASLGKFIFLITITNFNFP